MFYSALGFVSIAFLLLNCAPDAHADEIVVETTIQAAVNAARPGDTVRVPPGTYRENVLVTRDNITIRGSSAAVLDGTGLAGDTGIRVTPVAPATRIHGFGLSGLRIQNYRENGVRLEKVDNFRIRGGRYINNRQYGIFPVLSSNGLIELNHVSGADDTGIYVGQSQDIAVKNNQIRNCTNGIEIENSSQINVHENRATENTVGILVVVLPSLQVTATIDIRVTNNTLSRNNRPNPVTDPSDLLSLLPSGVGFLNVGGDHVIVRNNLATHNNSAGIVIIQLPPDVAALDPRIEPFPDDNEIRNNVALHNGSNPDPKLASRHLPGADLLWDLSGTANCWAGNVFTTSFPTLPACP